MRENRTHSAMLLGEVASPGAARGPAFVCTCAERAAVPRRTLGVGQAQTEMERFDAAISDAENELRDLQQRVQRQVGEPEADIFETHILLLHDSALREEISTRCLRERINIEAALAEAIDELTATFARMEDLHFRERAADFRDIGNRLLDILAKRRLRGIPALPEESIMVTDELLPSLVAQLHRKTIRGLVLERGGQTAHATILARSLGIPSLIRVRDATKRIKTGDPLIVDGLAGRVFVKPSLSTLGEYDRLEAALKAHQHALKGLVDLPAVTQDGVAITLSATIGKVADAAAAASLNADGIGLYRTEFAFLVQDHFPSEDEQYQLYRATAEQMNARHVVIRVLDLGSDKLLPYFPLPREANPSLGRRGTRLLLKYPEILRAQLRAILRLSATHPISILFPMVGDVEELLAAKAVIETVKAQLETDCQPFNRDILVGAMIETPSAAIMSHRLAQEVDFFSIGTNDLVQYLLSTDRTSSEVASYYAPLHPAVLQVLASLAATANAKVKSISLCGEMAGNPSYTQLLLGLGFRSLSVTPLEILEIKNAIRSTSIPQAEALAKRVLAMSTVREIKECLHEAQAQHATVADPGRIKE
ncbi:MAG: phosphoenolpyruvate-protein phosphotransferase [Deltaproteobacteria bacterium]|nr:phosphoenolpyruvate-protein phosphotransferase [Deltaproteobacteria bacterium]